MKRFSFIFLGALVIFMAGCSKFQQPEEDAWVDDLSLRVPIEFGSSLLETKASVTDLSQVGQLSVFGLDKTPGSSWVKGQDAAILYNVKATINSEKEIELSDGPYFYPLVSTYNYNFYATSPSKSVVNPIDVTPSYDMSDGIYVYANLGQDDILWARSIAEKYGDYDGYNARYMRYIRTNRLGTGPELKLEHVTTYLEFSAKANVESTSLNPLDNEDFTHIKITNISVNGMEGSQGVPMRGLLCVANQTDSQKEGKIFNLHDYRSSYTPADFIAGKSPTKEGTNLGGVFVYPDYSQGGTYIIKVRYQDSQRGTTEEKEFTTPILEPGTKYNFSLTFHQNDVIKIKVDLGSWIDKYYDADMSDDVIILTPNN